MAIICAGVHVCHSFSCGEQTGGSKDDVMGEKHFKFILLLSVWYCLLLKMSFQARWTFVPTKYIHCCVLVAPLWAGLREIICSFCEQWHIPALSASQRIAWPSASCFEFWKCFGRLFLFIKWIQGSIDFNARQVHESALLGNTHHGVLPSYCYTEQYANIGFFTLLETLMRCSECLLPESGSFFSLPRRWLLSLFSPDIPWFKKYGCGWLSRWFVYNFCEWESALK